MLIPDAETARAILEEAHRLNSGPWYAHSLNVAIAARGIAKQCSHLDPEAAYAMGLLHDIGRRNGVTALRHVIDGHAFLSSMGYDDAARICLTHSFPLKDIRAFAGKWDCTDQQVLFLGDYILTVDYDDYDRLIQLCDALALPTGHCSLEKRFVDVVIRHGFNPLTIDKWKATYSIQAYFEALMGRPIYDCLPGVVEPAFHTQSQSDPLRS